MTVVPPASRTVRAMVAPLYIQLRDGHWHPFPSFINPNHNELSQARLACVSRHLDHKHVDGRRQNAFLDDPVTRVLHGPDDRALRPVLLTLAPSIEHSPLRGHKWPGFLPACSGAENPACLFAGFSRLPSLATDFSRWSHVRLVHHKPPSGGLLEQRLQPAIPMPWSLQSSTGGSIVRAILNNSAALPPRYRPSHTERRAHRISLRPFAAYRPNSTPQLLFASTPFCAPPKSALLRTHGR